MIARRWLSRMTAVALLPGTLAPSAPARADETGYVATLAAPAPKARLVVHGLLWRCAGQRCVAPAGNSRPLIVCQALSRAVGPVVAFSGAGETLPPALMLRCNHGQGVASQ